MTQWRWHSRDHFHIPGNRSHLASVITLVLEYKNFHSAESLLVQRDYFRHTYNIYA